jgi:hypothetical protein
MQQMEGNKMSRASARAAAAAARIQKIQEVIAARGADNFVAYNNPSVIITPAGQPAVFPFGLKGSLTRLANGDPYLIAGDNITITSQSNGPITISSNSSASISAGGNNTHVQYNVGGDALGGDSAFVFNSSTDTLTVTNIRASLTQLPNGDPYLVAGDGILITTGALGDVTISSTASFVDWSSYTPSIGATTTNPTLPTSKNLYGKYSSQGKVLTLIFSFSGASSTGAAAGSGDYTISLPAGYTIDTNVVTLGATSPYLNGTSVGTATLQTDTAGSGGAWSVVPRTNQALVLVGQNPSSSSQPLVWGSSQFPIGSAGEYRISFVATIPVI